VDDVGYRQHQEQSLHIAPHVHVCVTRDGSVVLDLKRDQYYGFSIEDTEMLSAAVDGWPSPSSPSIPHRVGARTPQGDRLCLSLLQDGLLTWDGAAARDIHVNRIDLKAPLVSVGDELEVRGHVRSSHVASFAAAYLSAQYSLRCRSFISTVGRVRLAKCRNSEAAAAPPCDPFRLGALVDVFRRLRPYAFAAEGHCLLHALTLVNFLRVYDCYPDWVIGVSTQPWAAHSWVQWGVFLLDTSPEKVCQYTPIMVV